jgi:RHS repeat-associated protein
MEYGESAGTQAELTYQDYLFGGKEFDREYEINAYDFKARFYDITDDRFWSMDPMAEKYYSISPYAYCANNPVKLIDPNGKEIIISSEIIDSRKKVFIDVTGKVTNSTSTNYTHDQMQKYAERLMSSISNSYSGSGENIDYRCSVNLTVANSDNPVTSSDHVFNIVEQGSVQGYERNLNAAGSTRIGSMKVDLSQSIVDVFPAPYGDYGGTGKSLDGNATLERTGSHEFGHTAGLKHSTDTNNLMKQTRDPNAGMKITEDQILKIVNDYNDNKLNK